MIILCAELCTLHQHATQAEPCTATPALLSCMVHGRSALCAEQQTSSPSASAGKTVPDNPALPVPACCMVPAVVDHCPAEPRLLCRLPADHAQDRGSVDNKHRPVSLEVLRVESMRRNNASARDRAQSAMRADSHPGFPHQDSPPPSPTRQLDLSLAQSQDVLLAPAPPRCSLQQLA